MGTLLGPEGSSRIARLGASFGPSLLANRHCSVVGWWQASEVWWDRLLFENYTVDASIFVVMTSY